MTKKGCWPTHGKCAPTWSRRCPDGSPDSYGRTLSGEGTINMSPLESSPTDFVAEEFAWRGVATHDSVHDDVRHDVVAPETELRSSHEKNKVPNLSYSRSDSRARRGIRQHITGRRRQRNTLIRTPQEGTVQSFAIAGCKESTNHSMFPTFDIWGLCGLDSCQDTRCDLYDEIEPVLVAVEVSSNVRGLLTRKLTLLNYRQQH